MHAWSCFDCFSFSWLCMLQSVFILLIHIALKLVRFPPKFILYVCHESLIWVLSSWETCYGGCSCSCWGDSWLAIFHPGLFACHDLCFGQKIQTIVYCWRCNLYFSPCKLTSSCLFVKMMRFILLSLLSVACMLVIYLYIITLLIVSIIFQGLSVLVDFYYYRRWTSSVLNLLIYNVLGGGESHLYGTEGPLFYLRNGFNNFNFCFILAILFVAIFPVIRKKYDQDLLVVISPLYIWLAFMSLQPHKEER